MKYLFNLSCGFEADTVAAAGEALDAFAAQLHELGLDVTMNPLEMCVSAFPSAPVHASRWGRMRSR